ncbi:ribonuclease E inhibitor RraB [Schaalia vaccimaxillae]|uniref:ribonuclease E inhibitor RraB n=1 Tax=Schaalia vaccimaxillae TaxID=183916 RepID=UPI0003B3139D|nr:ribonuclease E inhibitor RraB [Schaalia vaccimaxillae]
MGIFDFISTRRHGNAKDKPSASPIEEPITPEPPPSSGNEDDDAQIRFIAERSDLTLPRRWIHYLSFSTTEAAREAVREARQLGWPLMRQIHTDELSGRQVVILSRSDLCVDWDSVRSTRELLTKLAEDEGGSYDSWEAAVQPA